MFKPTMTALAVATALGAAPPALAVTDAELAELREQLRRIEEQYEQRTDVLEKRLRQAESTAVQTATRTTPAAFNPEISLILNGTYGNFRRDPKDYAITGYIPPGNDVSPGKRGFSLKESELVFAANIDPYFRGVLLASIDEDDSFGVEEAYFQTLSLPAGLGLKAGRFFSAIGYQNEIHPHARDFVDAPLVYRAFWGDSYGDDGMQVRWVAPTETLIEIGGELGRGRNIPGEGSRDKNGSGGGTLFAHIGDDVGASHSYRLGVSGLRTSNKDKGAGLSFNDIDPLGNAVVNNFAGDTRIVGADFVWKWAPNRNASYTSFKLQAEYFRRQQDGRLVVDTTGANLAASFKRAQAGYYVQGVYQLVPRWRVGLRYDRLNSGSVDAASNAANLQIADYSPSRANVMVDYSFSEFSRLRVQYNQDKSRQDFTDDQFFVQYVMSLGAHGAHRF